MIHYTLEFKYVKISQGYVLLLSANIFILAFSGMAHTNHKYKTHITEQCELKLWRVYFSFKTVIYIKSRTFSKSTTRIQK